MQSDLGRLIATFGDLESNGFDTENYLKWFFFIDNTENKLQILFSELEDSGYAFEYLKQVERNAWMLYVTKVEILSTEKLHKRNIAFHKLAEHCEVLLYNGWDVEKL